MVCYNKLDDSEGLLLLLPITFKELCFPVYSLRNCSYYVILPVVAHDPVHSLNGVKVRANDIENAITQLLGSHHTPSLSDLN